MYGTNFLEDSDDELGEKEEYYDENDAQVEKSTSPSKDQTDKSAGEK